MEAEVVRIHQNLPEGAFTNIFVSGELVTHHKNEEGYIPRIFTERLYLHGKTDPFWETFTGVSESLGNEINAEKRQLIDEKIKEIFGDLAEYDLPDLYNQVKEELSNILGSSPTMGKMQSAILESSVIIGDKTDLQDAFLIRISVSGAVGKMIIITKQEILADPVAAREKILAEAQKFMQSSAKEINDTIDPPFD